MAIKTPDEILEEQRAEATKEYAKKIHALKLQANDLEDKCKNLNKTLGEAFKEKSMELNQEEERLRLLNISLDESKAHVAAMRRESDTILSNAHTLFNKATLEYSEHKNNVDNHFNSVETTKADFLIREGKCLERETSCNIKEKLADDIMNAALEKEKEVVEKIEEFNKTFESISTATLEQKSISIKNAGDMEELNIRIEEFEKTKYKYKEDHDGLMVIRNDLDSARVNLSKRKSDLDDKENNLKAEKIKIDLANERLLDKEKDINAQSSRLNELKNNVEILLKKQEESKGA